MKMQKVYFIIVLALGIIFLYGCRESEAVNSNNTPAIENSDGEAEVQAAAPLNTAPDEQVADQSAKSGPRIQVTKAVHDFGTIGPDTHHECDFTFKNAGTETLKIQQVQSTCGCSVPTLDKKEYEPGEEGTVEVRFHSSATKGKVSKHLYIISNDVDNPRAELEIKATVVVNLEVKPDQVKLRLDQPNAGMGPITIRSTDEKVFVIKSFAAAGETFKAEFDPSKRAREHVLNPIADVNALSSNPSGVMRIETDHPHGGMMMVSYSTLPRYEISRPRIIIQNAAPGAKEVEDVIIRSNYGETLAIESSSSRLGSMKILDHTTEENALKLTIEITLPSDANRRRYFSDELTVRFTNGEEQVIRSSGWFKR